MKSNHFTFIFAALMIAAGCNSNRNNEGKGKQQTEKVAAVINLPDSLKQPTGNVKLDSLLQAASVAPQDTNLVMLYRKIGLIYSTNNLQKTKEYLLKMKDMSDQMDWNKGRYLFASDYTVMLSNQLLLDSALVVNQQALELAKKENNADWIANQSMRAGEIYLNKSWYETALQFFMDVLPYYEQNNNTYMIGYVYMLMSYLYLALNENERAIEYGNKALDFRKDEYTLTNLGNIYATAYQVEKAKSCYLEGLRLCEQNNNSMMKVEIYAYLSDNALEYSTLETVEKYLNLAAEYNREIHNRDVLILLLRSRIEAFKGNFALSEKQVKEALKIAKEQTNLELQKHCYTTLSELSIAQRRDFREYMQYHKEISMIDNTLAKERSVHSAEEMAAKYETEKKNLEIAQQKQIIKNQNLQRGLLAGGVGVLVVFLALLWYLLRLRTRQNRLLEETNATKDRFFSIISHDLKNPAIAQRDALQMLLDHEEDWDAKTLKHYYHSLLKSADGQVNLLYNLLNWAQVQTGRMPFRPAPFDLAAELQKTDISLLQNMANRKGIAFTVEMPETAIVTGDTDMLVTVVRNLLTNAIKFTPAGGQVTLNISPCDPNRVSNPVRVGQYTISVTDTGVGIVVETGHVETGRALSLPARRGTAGEPGSGLGLIVCRELLAKHGCELHVESEEGKGSRFWFEIA